MTRRPLPLANAATFAAFVAAASDPRGRPTTDVLAWPEGYPATDWRIARAETLAGGVAARVSVSVPPAGRE